MVINAFCLNYLSFSVTDITSSPCFILFSFSVQIKHHNVHLRFWSLHKKGSGLFKKKKKEVTDYMFGRKKNLEVSLKIIVVTEK